MGPLGWLAPLAHGGAAGAVVEITVLVGLAILIVAVVIQGRREVAEDEGDDEGV